MAAEGDNQAGPPIPGGGDGSAFVQQAVDSGEDSIQFVFTGEQHSEFLSDPGLHVDLTDWLVGSPEQIVMHGPASNAEAQDLGRLDWEEQPVFVVYGSPPGIEATPANDEPGYMFLGGHDELFPNGGDSAGQDELLGALGDSTFDPQAEDILTAAARLGTEAAGENSTFLLTHLDIGDLIGDYDQVRGAGISDLDAQFFDHYLVTAQSAPDPAFPGMTVEIEDDLGAAVTHILI
jgi:hypothetical protein